MPGGVTFLASLNADIPTPAAGKATVFFSLDSGVPSYKNSAGTVLPLGTNGLTGATGPTGPALGLLWEANEIEPMMIAGPVGPAGASGIGTGLVLLDTRTASGNATLDFTSLITSTYDMYIIEVLNALPSADASLQMLMSTDNGATWLAGTNYEYAIQLINQAGTVSTAVSTGTTQFFIGTAESSAGRSGVCASIKLFNPLSATLRKAMTFHSMGDSSDGNQYNLTGMLFLTNTTAVNAYQFKFSAGNIATGIFRLYGVSK